MNEPTFSSTHEAARHYMSVGFSVIPVPAGSKNPGRNNWQKERYTEKDVSRVFNNGANIGIQNGQPSRNVVDVDLDTLEAAAAARYFLQSTGATFGRPGKPRSHMLYRVSDGVKTHQFKDTPKQGKAATMLLELRSTGTQSLLPPSKHPSGEHYEWEVDGDPAEVESEKLLTAVRATAACALIARHWPQAGTGVRHNFALALAGYLARRGLPVLAAEKTIGVAALIAGDEEVSDRRTAVQDTYSRVERGEETTGLPTLIEILGKQETNELCRRLTKWLKLTKKGNAHARSGASEGIRPLTDTGNAERFAARFGQGIRYCFPWKKWLYWTGRRFRRDDGGRILRMSKVVARAIREEAKLCQDPDIQEAVIKWGRTSEGLGRRKAMTTLTAGEVGVAVVPDELDRSHWNLNVRNGTLNLKTRELQPHRQEDLITKVAPVEYAPEAQCPKWLAFLERVLPDSAVRSFVQKTVGYSLTGDVSAQIVILLYGTGANGKSTFLCILLDLLGGDFAIQAAPELLLTKRRSEHPTEIADLFGVRVAICVEIGAGRRFNEVLVKQLTGGDRIRARRLYEDFFEFSPTHKLWIAANHKPVVKGTDHAIWRRIRLVPFTVTIPESEQDPKLLEKLRGELPGILNWALDGLAAWEKDGLEPPTAVQEATSTYREEMDVLGDFIDTCCVVHPRARVGATDLYRCYLGWSEENAEAAADQRAFGLRMTERGFERVKIKGKKTYKGLGLRSGFDGGDDGDQGGPDLKTPSENAEIRRRAGGPGPTGPTTGPPRTSADEEEPTSASDNQTIAATAQDSAEGPPRSPSSPLPSRGDESGVNSRDQEPSEEGAEEEVEWRF